MAADQISSSSAPSKKPQGTLLEEACLAHSAKRLSEAEQLYRKYLTSNPDDARALHNLGVIGLQTGHVDAAIELIERSLSIDDRSADVHCNLGLALKQAGRNESAENAYRSAIEIDPKMVDAHSNLGILLQEMHRYDEALIALGAAVSLAPKDGNVLSNLGLLELRTSRSEQALKHLTTAAEAEPGNAKILSNLGGVLADQKHYIEAIGRFEEAHMLERDQAHIPFNLGRCYFNIGKIKKAIRWYEESINIDPEFAAAHHNLGHAMLADGRLEKGWREYQWRWRSPNYEHSRDVSKLPLWGGEPIKDKRLLIRSEQGIGDKLLFASILPEVSLQGRQITVETDKRLVPVFERSFPGLDVNSYPNNDEKYDYQIWLGDLPSLFRPQLTSFPKSGGYIFPDRGLRDHLKSKYYEHNKILVGISWHSKKPKTIPLSQFSPLFELPNCKFVNLQYGDHSTEIQQFESDIGQHILTDDSIDPLLNFDNFVAQVAAMDAVVTIQNTTLYTAGGLGVPTFAILPPIPDWRWLGQRAKSPWHDNVHLCQRSGQFGGDAVETIILRIKKYLADME